MMNKDADTDSNNQRNAGKSSTPPVNKVPIKKRAAEKSQRPEKISAKESLLSEESSRQEKACCK